MGKQYIHGRKNIACCSLIDHLKDNGVLASVGHDNKHKATLFVYVQSGDVRKVPSEWDGFPVVAEETGPIEPC